MYSRYKNQSELPAHNEINKKLLSGEIEYIFENETDIFVSNGKDGEELDFYKNMKGQYAVPGSTIRGLIRSNMTILGFCAVEEDIANDRFMFRNFTSRGKISKTYKAKLGINNNNYDIKYENIHAGYICKEGKNYCIYRTVDVGNTNSGSDFYIVNERYVHRHMEDFSYIDNEEEGRSCLMYTSDNFVTEKYKDKKGNIKIKIYNKDINENYAPRCLPVSYKLKGSEVIGIAEPEKADADKSFKKGYAVFTGRINNEKKCFYVVPAPDRDNKIEYINPSLITAFKNDVDIKRNQLGDNVEYYSLPGIDGALKPVFYMGDTEIENFGFTPMMRLFYEKSVGDGIHQSVDSGIDYKSAIFGFIDNKEAYKSRVYFEDAATKCNETVDLQKRMLMGPMPTSYMDYLDPVADKNGNMSAGTYLDDEFSIRGIKQYWLTNSTVEDKPKNKGSAIASFLKPIEAGASFEGKIKFKNLYEDELGLLLWCIRLEDNCRHNIGMGKPFGFGKIRFTDIKLRMYDYTKMYETDTLSLNVLEKEYRGADAYIQEYKSRIEKFLGGSAENRRLEKNSSITAFLRMKSELPNIEVIRYMDIDKREYQSRNIPLPSIDYVLGAKDYKSYLENLTEEAPFRKSRENTVYTANITDKNKKDKNSSADIMFTSSGKAVGKSLSALSALFGLESKKE